MRRHLFTILLCALGLCASAQSSLTEQLIVNYDFELKDDGTENTTGETNRGIPYGWQSEGTLEGNSFGINKDANNKHGNNACWINSKPMPETFKLYQTIAAGDITPGRYRVTCLLGVEAGRETSCCLFANNNVQYYGTEDMYTSLLVEGENATYAGYTSTDIKDLKQMTVYVDVAEGESLTLGIRTGSKKNDGTTATDNAGWFKVDYFQIENVDGQTTPYTGSVPQDGGVYFLYNVKTGQWLNKGYGKNNNPSRQTGVDEKGCIITLKRHGETDGYDIHFGGDLYYRYESWGGAYFVSNYSQQNPERFNIEPVEGMDGYYKIILDYNKDHHLAAVDNTEDPITKKYKEGNDVWQFVTPLERYNLTSYSPYTGAELVAGQKYYLYNVNTDKWLNTGYGIEGRQTGVDDKGFAVTLKRHGDTDGYDIHFTGDDYYCYEDWGVKTYYVAHYNWQAAERFNFEPVAGMKGHYKIILDFNKNRHLAAVDNSQDPITETYEQGADIWQFVTPEEKAAKNKDITFASAAEGYSTLCLPYQAVIPEGVTAYKASAPDADGVVSLTAIDGMVLPANEAVLLKKSNADETYMFKADNGTTVANFADNCFKGNSTSESVTLGSLGYAKVLTLGHSNESGAMGFYTYTGTTIGANKAYYPIENATESSLARGFAIVVDDEATAISSAAQNAATTKYIYDLCGCRVKEMNKRGIYVVNGKKVVIK